MTTGTKVTVSTTWTEDGVAYSAQSNDGTGVNYYSQWPNPATSDYIVVCFQPGQAGYRVGDASSWDISARASALMSITGDPATVNFETSFGGILDEDSLDNFLYDAAQIYVRYTSSDMWTGARAAGVYKVDNTNTTKAFYGHWNLRCLVKEILTHANAADYSKVIFVGWGQSGWGLMLQWKWLHDYAVSLGFTPYGIFDGWMPAPGTPYTGTDAFFYAETYRMQQYWSTPASLGTAWDTVSIAADWTDAQAERFMIMSFLTSTERAFWYGLDLASVATNEAAWMDGAAQVQVTAAGLLRRGVRIFMPYYTDGTSYAINAIGRMTTSTFWATAVEPYTTPAEAVESFVNGEAVHMVEAIGTFPSV